MKKKPKYILGENWLCLEATHKNVGKTGTYKVAYITDDQLFDLFDKTDIFIKAELDKLIQLNNKESS